MVLSVIFLFTLTALLGVAMVVLGVGYRRSSGALAMGHASLALLAFSLLVVHLLRSPIDKLYNNAALLLFLGICGGVVLFLLRDGRKPPQMFVVGLHALMALAGLLLLVYGYMAR